MEEGESAGGMSCWGAFIANRRTGRKPSRLSAALKLAPGNAAVHCDLGTALLKQGEPDKARTNWRAVQIEPDNATYHFTWRRCTRRGAICSGPARDAHAGEPRSRSCHPVYRSDVPDRRQWRREGETRIAAQEWERCAADNPDVFMRPSSANASNSSGVSSRRSTFTT